MHYIPALIAQPTCTGRKFTIGLHIPIWITLRLKSSHSVTPAPPNTGVSIQAGYKKDLSRVCCLWVCAPVCARWRVPGISHDILLSVLQAGWMSLLVRMKKMTEKVWWMSCFTIFTYLWGLYWRGLRGNVKVEEKRLHSVHSWLTFLSQSSVLGILRSPRHCAR